MVHVRIDGENTNVIQVRNDLKLRGRRDTMEIEKFLRIAEDWAICNEHYAELRAETDANNKEYGGGFSHRVEEKHLKLMKRFINRLHKEEIDFNYTRGAMFLRLVIEPPKGKDISVISGVYGAGNLSVLLEVARISDTDVAEPEGRFTIDEAIDFIKQQL